MATPADWSHRRAVAPLKILVIGAGITGLATALALKQTGHTCLVLERRETLREIGAGLQLPLNAVRILHRLGLRDEVLAKTSLLTDTSVR
jgi:salicylate hydroxylase